MDEYYKLKYLEYKLKYLALKEQATGGFLGSDTRETIKNREQVAVFLRKLAFWKTKKSYPVLYDEYNPHNLTKPSDNIINECKSATLDINKACKDTSTDNLKKLLDSLDPVNNNGCKDETIIKARDCINLREEAINIAEAETKAKAKAEAEYYAKIEARASAAKAKADADARKNAEERVRQLKKQGREFRRTSPPSSPLQPLPPLRINSPPSSPTLPPLRGQLPKPLAPSVASIATRQKMYHM
jgi:hypothetical protein